MHLEFMRDKAKEMPFVPEPEKIDTMSIWHCKFRTLQPVAQFSNLRKLKIATFPDSSLECLSGLELLESLSVLHLPKITDLTPLENLRNLRFLELQTLPSWDISHKRTKVASLEPFTRLIKLEHVSLLGVVPMDKSLAILEKCGNLAKAKFFGYPKSEIDRFFAATGIENAHIAKSDKA